MIEADTAAAGLRLVEEAAPDLVLLDVQLPDSDGYEICRRIKTDPATCNTAVMLLSGIRTSSEDQSEGLEIGADGYLVRPIANRELLARVRAMERIIRAERERDRLIASLREALAQVKTLGSLLPICANCKKIRNDSGYWEQIEVYIRDHAGVDFSHGICPECEQAFYGDFLGQR